MSKKKSPGLPSTPEFQADPNVAWSQDTLKGEVPKLLGLSGLPAGLMEAISTNPQITQLTLDKLQAQLAPSYRQGNQNIINQLEANNQLTGSTTASALGNYEADYLSQLTAAGAEAGIQDINRALTNRMSLYGLGINTAGAVGQAGLGNQEQMNQFALQNYENQVAAALMNQPKNNSGMWSTLGGIAGGAIGTMVAPGVGTMVGAGLGSSIGSGFSGGSTGPGLGAAAYSLGNRQMSSPFSTSGGGESIYNPIYSPSTNGAMNYFGGYGLN
jgi:hypothetical protein